MLALTLVWLRAAADGAPWLVAIAAGVIAGMFAAIGGILWPLLLSVALLCAAAALVVVGAAEASAGVGLLTGAIAIAVCAVWLFTYYGFYIASIARPGRNNVVERFGEGNQVRRALVIHHPSPGGFLTGHLRTLAQALAQRGWQVELSVADPTGTTPHGKRDLVVLAAPVFSFRPPRAMVEQIRRLALTGENTVLIVSGYGMTEPAMRYLQRLVASKGARLISSVEIWTMRPNSERHGIDDIAEIMRRTADTVSQAAMPESKAA
jgi:hypothetical protein